jgi:PhnB protein
MNDHGSRVSTSIAPWLAVRKGAEAVEFYKSAFRAVEQFRIESETGDVVARLAVDEAEFWVSDESPEHSNFSPAALGGSTCRMILTVEDPDAMFDRTVVAGAEVVSVVEEQHGWRVGRVADPYGHHWEIGKSVVAEE